MDRFETERIKYKPKKINFLFVAETPPKSNSERFFYFENVKEQDSLFIETMKVLYPTEVNKRSIKELRNDKAFFLEKFKKDGFYLIDALEKPFEIKYSTSQKIKLIKEGQLNLLKKIKQITDMKSRIILISATVYKANFQFLNLNGINVINEELVDFPGSGGQIKFKQKLQNVLNNYNFNCK